MKEFLRFSVSLLAVLLVGLIAGLLVGTAIDHYRLRVLDAPAWTLARQSIDGVFSKLLPWWWNSTLLLLLFSAYLHKGQARWLFLCAVLLLLFGIVITVAIEVPINKAIASWTPASIPTNWMDFRERWLSFHTVRSVAGVLAFVCALVGFGAKK